MMDMTIDNIHKT